MIQKLINFYDVTKENIKEHNPNWLKIHDHPYRMLIIGGSGSKAFVDYSNDMNNIFKNIEQYNHLIQQLIVFNDIIADIISCK